MVQGGGTLDGVCEYHYEDEGVRLTFDNNGTDLVYACVFADFDGLTMVALSDIPDTMQYILYSKGVFEWKSL